MGILALASDYDDTLAAHGELSDATAEALRRFKSSGRKLILVTGRILSELQQVCPSVNLFDLVVAENGAVITNPAYRGVSDPLTDAPPQSFYDALQAAGVEPLFRGQVIVSTLTSEEGKVRKVVNELGLALDLIFNKGSLMILPRGVNKATGLRAALGRLKIDSKSCCAVGDAENDLSFLEAVGFPAAVANAVPELRAIAAFVTPSRAGDGVIELIDRLLA